MNPSDFKAPEAGRIVRMPQGYTAFLPAPLPPRLDYDDALVLTLSQADAAVSELSGLGRLLPNPHLLIAPTIRREAVLSSRIEGTRTTLSELLVAEAAGASRHADPDRQAVQNYINALEYGIRRLAELPLSLRLVREVHAHLMAGVRGSHATPGEFRRSQNWIGPPGSTLATAPYVPPPPDFMLDALGRWEHFLHDRGAMPDLIQCGLMHEQFEAIHPFLDGNGRVGRLLIILFLIERGRLSEPLLSLSAFFEAHRQDYYDLLQRVRTHGDWVAWLRFFLTGVTETAGVAIRQIGSLIQLRDDYRSFFVSQTRVLVLLDELFANPYITVRRAAEVLDVSTTTASKIISTLRSEGILEEISGRSWGRLFLARPILGIIEPSG